MEITWIEIVLSLLIALTSLGYIYYKMWHYLFIKSYMKKGKKEPFPF
jgi:hypothetical protein